ncbi:hypothetical protein [Myxococcus sp. AB025B]|uniref:hypothetical protein n=1 Tax=Myxococcus sp. AB025B TaxID=2562794 RepID=UPI001141A730|nr:hypothetical protein [Myxococcus sp. AB025B]
MGSADGDASLGCGNLGERPALVPVHQWKQELPHLGLEIGSEALGIEAAPNLLLGSQNGNVVPVKERLRRGRELVQVHQLRCHVPHGPGDAPRASPGRT